MATKPYDTDVEALVDLFAEREMRAVDAERAAHSSKVDELAEQFRNEARTDLKAALERSEAQWFSEVGRLRDERNLEYDRAEKAAKALDEARSQLQRAVGLLRWLMSADDVKDADDPRYAEIRTLTSLPIPQESTTQEGGPK
jgi:hypothetical protein